MIEIGKPQHRSRNPHETKSKFVPCPYCGNPGKLGNYALSLTDSHSNGNETVQFGEETYVLFWYVDCKHCNKEVRIPKPTVH